MGKGGRHTAPPFPVYGCRALQGSESGHAAPRMPYAPRRSAFRTVCSYNPRDRSLRGSDADPQLRCGFPTGAAACATASAGAARSTSAKQLVELRDVVDGDRAPEVLAEHVHLVAVSPRQDDPRQPAALGGQQLLADAADWQHLPAEPDLAGHRDVAAQRAAPSAPIPA